MKHQGNIKHDSNIKKMRTIANRENIYTYRYVCRPSRSNRVSLTSLIQKLVNLYMSPRDKNKFDSQAMKQRNILCTDSFNLVKLVS